MPDVKQTAEWHECDEVFSNRTVALTWAHSAYALVACCLYWFLPQGAGVPSWPLMVSLLLASWMSAFALAVVSRSATRRQVQRRLDELGA